MHGDHVAGGGVPILVVLLLHLVLMASPAHGRAMPPLAPPDAAPGARMAEMASMPIHAAAGLALAVPASASHPVPDCQLEPVPPPASPVPRALAPVPLLLWAPGTADSVRAVGSRFQPPKPLQLADPQALLQVFRV